MMNLDNLIPVAQMCTEDAQEAAELTKMYERARDYLSAHEWCQSIEEAYLGFGVCGVVAIFLFFVKINTDTKELLWVVEGDLPSAYLVTDRASTADVGLEIYANLMEEWIVAVRGGTGLEDVFPVDAPADEEHANLLESRINLLRSEIIPAAAEGTK